MDALYERGRQLYDRKRFRPAILEFTKAANLCPCNKGGTRRPRCSCKDFEGVAERDGDLFHEAMFACYCEAQSYSKCDQERHTQALNSRAACFVKLDELDRAAKDACWMMELSPRKTEGWLRLIQVARLQKKDRYAWRLSGALLKLAKAEGRYDEPAVQEAWRRWSRLQVRFALRDPVATLPAELLVDIFGHMELVQLVRFLRVSKTWKGTLTSDALAPIWRDLSFRTIHWKNGPSLSSLRSIARYAKHNIRKLVVLNGTRLAFDPRKVNTILSGSSRIDFLDLRYPVRDAGEESGPRYNINVQQLKYLRVDGYAHPGILEQAAQHLRHLRLGECSHFGTFTHVSFPSLRFLDLTSGPRQDVSIPGLVRAAPALEGLAVRNIRLNGMASAPRPLEAHFRHLKTVIARYDYSFGNNPPPLIFEPSPGRQIKHLDLDIFKAGIDCLPAQPWAVDPTNEERWDSFATLEVLRVGRHNPSSTRVRDLLQGSTNGGFLRHIDVPFLQDGFNDAVGTWSCTTISEYEWLRGCESIRSLGLLRFNFKRFAARGEDMPLLGFVSSFRNLENLEINAPHYHEVEDALLVVKDILQALRDKERRLKTIWVEQLKGFPMEKLRELAALFGVEAISEKPHPYYWPKPGEEGK